jgi:hypothetical protein
VDNIKTDLRNTGLEDVDWIKLASGQGPVADSCEHGNKLFGSVQGGEIIA